MRKSLLHVILGVLAILLLCQASVQSELLFAPAGTLSTEDEKSLTENSTWVEDYGSYKVFKSAIQGADHSDISVKGGWNISMGDALYLEAARIETSAPQAAAVSMHALVTYPGGAVFKLVQFRGPIKEAWIESLRSQGMDPISYVPDFAYLVAIPEGSSPDMNQIEGVKWIGDYLPEYRIQPAVHARLATDAVSPVKLTVQVARVTSDSGITAQGLLLAQGAKILSHSAHDSFENFRVEVSATSVSSLALLPDVIWIEITPEYELHGERGAQIAAGAFAPAPPLPDCTSPGYATFLSDYGLGGSGRIMQVMDSGLDRGIATNLPGTAHADFLGRITGIFNATSDANGSDLDGHGTINAGIVMGNATLGTLDPDGFKLGQGVAPLASVYATKIFRSSGPFDLGSNTLSSLITNAMQAGATFSTNSWGANVAGDYTADSQEFDLRVRDGNTAVAGNQAMTIFVSTGNAGDDTVSGVQTLGAPATAKNVIAVGASENCDANGTDGCGTPAIESDNLSDMTEFSSRGPTNDGRIGVTIVAPGAHISGPASTAVGYNGSGVCDQYFPIGQTNYARSTGTSHSTPIVAGAGILISEFYTENAPAPLGGGPVVTPSPALTKALMIAGADDMFGGSNGKGGTLPHRPEPVHGWGRLNMRNIFENLESGLIRDQHENNLLTFTGQEELLTVYAVNPSQPVTVVLVWTDPAANPAVLNTLINNLDLEVVVGGSTYRGNVFSEGISVTGGSPDALNNTEAVFLTAASGAIQIRVRATNLAGNGLPGNGSALDQDYALVVFNATDVSSKGTVAFDESLYSCYQSVTVTVRDADLIGAGSLIVGISIPLGDREFLPLSEVGGGTGIFQGTIPIFLNPVVIDDQELQVQSGQVLTVLYQDSNIGNGNSASNYDTATFDCSPAIISNIQITNVGYDRLTISWMTNELASSGAGAGTSCGSSTISGIDPTLRISHSMTLMGLDPCTQYYVVARAEDVVDNSTTSDCVVVRTLDFESIMSDDLEPSSIAGWTHAATQGVDDWNVVNSVWASSPTHAWFSADVSTLKDARLMTPPVALDSTSVLTFMHTYRFESGYDGGVLEISTNGGSSWQDLGAYITEGGYTHTISSSFSSPISGRQAWSAGTVGAMTRVSVNVGAFAGTGRLVRFRLACDTSVASTGWHIDDIAISGVAECTNDVEFRNWTSYE